MFILNEIRGVKLQALVVKRVRQKGVVPFGIPLVSRWYPGSIPVIPQWFRLVPRWYPFFPLKAGRPGTATVLKMRFKKL